MSSRNGTRKPLLLLDVDGVIIPFGRINAEALVYPLLGTEDEYVRHDPRLCEWLASLRDHFDLVWATAWEHQANDVAAAVLSLPQLPVIVFDNQTELGADYKLPAIQRFVGTRACAWVDDSIGVDAHAWAEEREQPSLFLDIRPDRGLGATDVETLLRFAERARAEGADLVGRLGSESR